MNAWRRWHHSPRARSITMWPRVAHLLLMCHFSSSTYDLKMNAISVKYVTDFQWFCGLSDFLSRCMCHPVWTQPSIPMGSVLLWFRYVRFHLCCLVGNTVSWKIANSCSIYFLNPQWHGSRGPLIIGYSLVTTRLFIPWVEPFYHAKSSFLSWCLSAWQYTP